MPLWNKTGASAPSILTPEQLPNAIFIDAVTAKDPDNKRKGLDSAGWWLYSEYKDSSGNIRHKAEHLITMSSPSEDSGINQEIESSISEVTTAVLSFMTKPSNLTVTAPATATFSTVVAISPVGGAISYQWLKQDPTTKAYGDVADAGVYTGSATNTLTISDSTGLNGSVYKVMVSAPNAVSITSVAVKLTVL